MARILEYLECPQYLRRSIFPIHNSLQFAGIFGNETRMWSFPLFRTSKSAGCDAPSPLNRPGTALSRGDGAGKAGEEWAKVRCWTGSGESSSRGREGTWPCPSSHCLTGPGAGEFRLDSALHAHYRQAGQQHLWWLAGSVLASFTVPISDCKQLKGTLTSARAVREEAGVYWGYSVRFRPAFNAIQPRTEG
jgi:hypothetical protein